MIYRNTSAKEIVSRLFMGFKNYSVNFIPNTMEYIADGLEAIGIAGETITKYYITETNDHRGELPCDMLKLDGILYNGKPLQWGTGSFNHDEIGISAANPRFINDNSAILEGGYIKTSQSESCVIIQYQAFQKDEEDFPMIPDIMAFKEALYWYCVMKIMEYGVEHPMLKYEQVENKWREWRAEAKKKARIYDKVRMRALGNAWKRFIPTLNPDLQLYYNTGLKEDFR